MPVPPSHPFFEHLDAWSTWLAYNAGRSPATVAKYRACLERFARWVMDPPKDPRLAPTCMDPLSPSLDDLERFAGIYAHTLKLTPRARRPLVSALRGFFAWLASTGATTCNPAASLPQPKAGRPLPKAMQLRDAEKLLMSVDVSTLSGARDAAMLLLFMGCGFRLSGLRSLNESSLVWYDEEGREALAIRVTEKGDRERMQPVPREAAMLLRAYLGHDDLASIPRTLPNGDRVLFVSTNNRTIPAADYHGEARRISANYIQEMIRDRCSAAGVPADVAHPHALRHMFGAELEEDGVPLLQQQALLGHADPKSTKIYAHLAMRKLRRAAQDANPLAKIRAPLLDSLRSLDRAVNPQAHPRPHQPNRNPRPPSRRRSGS
jgi:integrase/recombinase XerD